MVLGLGLASAIIIAVVSFSQALSASQSKVLNPLQRVGTDLLVMRTVDNDNLSKVDDTTRGEYLTQNATELDLSKLGPAGSKFSDDVFTSGSSLTFDQTVTTKLNRALVSRYAGGLVLNVVHREGTVPKVTVSIKTGGEKIKVEQHITPLTAAEQASIDAAEEAAVQEIQSRGINPKSDEAAKIISDAIGAATPKRFKTTTTEIITPEHTITQEVDNIKTDVTTQNFTVAGVDTSKTDIGLLLSGQLVSGRYFTGDGQIIVSKAFAAKNNKKVGDTVTIKNTAFKVAGIAEPALYTNQADYYLPLAVLQKLAGREGRINVLQVKTVTASAVAQTAKDLPKLFPGATVADSKDTAQRVSGSLLQVADLTNRFIGIVGIIVVAAATGIAAIMAVASINKRTREIGTLKAIGWSNVRVIRQMSLENIATGLLGAAAGIAIGLVLIVALNHYGLSFAATIKTFNTTIGASGATGGPVIMPAGATTAAAVNVDKHIALHIDPSFAVMALGAGVALFGSLFAGMLAAIKVSRLKPQEALRSLE
jgi:ABC-type lipoprotein release transport system permease subunit